MHRLLRRLDRHGHCQSPLTARQGRIVGHRQQVIQSHQNQYRVDKSLRLTKRQIQQRAYHQGHFNGLVRVDILGTALLRTGVIPARQDRFVQPQRQATASDQGAIICRLVFYPIDRFFLDRGRGFRYVAHRRLFGKRGKCFLQETTTQSNWKACLVSTP